MIFPIIVGVLLIAFILVVLYFFSFTFVKHDIGNFEDMNDRVNKPLEKYKDVIQSGIDFIKSLPFQWVETVSFDGLRLAARYLDNKSDKTIILVHGYRSSALRDFSCAVKMYMDMGFNILLCDQRSSGRSDGKLITFGVKESRDVVGWVEFLNDRFAPKRIVLDGLSMGATTVILACRFPLPENVTAVIADCGFTSPVDIMKKVARQSFKINGGFFIPFLDMACRIIGRFSIRNISTVDALKKSKIPVLFIHGIKDGFVPCEMSERGYNAAPEGSDILLIPDAEHGLSFLVDEQGVKNKLNEFLKKNC